MTFIPKFHILTIRGKKSGILTIFGHVSAILEDLLTEKEKNGKTKKLHLVLEDMVKLFYFMTLIPKFHILATRGKQKLILTIFVHVLAILEDFLTEMEKMNKTKKLRLVNTFFKCGLRFFHFL